MFLDVLLGEDGGAGGDVADDRDGNRVAALGVCMGVGDELDGAGLAGGALDQPAALQLVQVVVDRGAGAEADGLADLTDARGIASDLGHVADVVEDLVLPFGQLFGQFDAISQIVFRTLKPTLANSPLKCKPLFDGLAKRTDVRYSPRQQVRT